MTSTVSIFVRACDQISSFRAKYLNDLRNVTEGGFESRKTMLERSFNQVESAYEKLLEPDAELENTKLTVFTQKYENVLTVYMDTVGIIYDELKKLKPSTSNTNTSDANATLFNQTQLLINEQKDIRLPAIKINKFTGDYKSWRSFRDLFQSMIGNSSKLKPVEKFYYLLGNLEGAPRDLISKYPLEDSSFEAAWNTLANEYENLRVLVNAQLKELFSIPVAKSESATGIKLIQTSVKDVLSALKALNVPTQDWDPILVYLVTKRLPTDTHTLWEQSLGSELTLPKWEAMDKFLQARFRTLEAVGEGKSQYYPPKVFHKPSNPNSQPRAFNYLHSNTSNICQCCKKSAHSLRKCEKFLHLSVSARQKIVKNNKACVNCLGYHKITECTSTFSCSHCQKRHHTLLHFPSKKTAYTARNTNTETTSEGEGSTSPALLGTVQANVALNNNQKILLSTALVKIVSNGQNFVLRALIDSGSEATFILESAMRKLRLNTRRADATITGMGSKTTATASRSVELTLLSKSSSEKKIQTNALVLKELTSFLPSEEIAIETLPNLQHLVLADPYFNKPGKIELVIGADIYSQILLGGVLKLTESLTAIETMFGHILIGSVESSKANHKIVSMFNSVTLDESIKRFWEMEEIYTSKPLSEDEKFCENFYKTTHYRRSDGRYVVRLPFVKEFPLKKSISHSRNIALKRFCFTETKFKKNPSYKDMYINVVKEYLSLGHMKQTSSFENITKLNNIDYVSNYYMPHHGVLKQNRTTTKLRVVFDGSCPSANSTSLNEILYSGPALQNDLTMVILRARRFPFIFSADIQMMYRQIFVNSKDTDYQRIIFRESPELPIRDYALQTVTFGLNCSPFLAIRTLHQLAEDEQLNFPLAVPIIKKDCYVDDIFSGAYSLEEAQASQKQTINLLLSGGFELRKWCANTPDLLADIPREYLTSDDFSEFSDESCPKTLGILWNNKLDYFTFRVNSQTFEKPLTKRNIFSEISKLFDPAGWLAPVVVKAKILMQQIWADGTDWDEKVEAHRALEWTQLATELTKVENIKIPRWLNILPTRTIEIHGFSDASEAAMCCCIYTRVISENGDISVNLVAAKTKVAPLKTVSLPRLELCAAVMLSKLIKNIKKDLEFDKYKFIAWCDSTITLAWIHSNTPHKWKTFVANRLTTIQENCGNTKWCFIRSEFNAADPGSRGLSPIELKDNKLWFSGPNFLQLPRSQWPNFENPTDITDLESKSIQINHAAVHDVENIITRFSTYHKAVRVLSYCFRFIARLRRQIANKCLTLTSQEIKNTKNRIFQLAQKQYFPQEYNNLEEKRSLSKKSTILSLNPFLDENGIIRMNGRLSNLALKYDEKFPIILPYQAFISKLVIEDIHRYSLHGNLQLMLNLLRKQFWVLRAKQKIKTVIHNCKSCFLEKKETMTQTMGALPMSRITVSKPFSHIGIDFGGPLNLKLYKGRCNKFSKGYICLFVCFSTKAIHLEAVTSLEGQAFLSAFRRFYSRRGLPSNVFLDNAGNHQAVGNYFNKEYKKAIKSSVNEAAEFLASRQIHFEYNCPLASHRAGLAEAGIKSVKHHLKRTLGQSILTFEELSTVLCQIEASLNSRPLTSLSDNNEDLNALTPGHFLTGDALLSPPEPSLVVENLNDFKRLDLLNKIKIDFWTRWKDEYLHQLRHRMKWKFPKENLKVGDLVVIKNDNTPPQIWPLGRVIEIVKNSDSFVRVCKIKTKTGEFLRPITKLCRLPFNSENTDN